jgi:hypothetical protein
LAAEAQLCFGHAPQPGRVDWDAAGAAKPIPALYQPRQGLVDAIETIAHLNRKPVLHRIVTKPFLGTLAQLRQDRSARFQQPGLNSLAVPIHLPLSFPADSPPARAGEF